MNRFDLIQRVVERSELPPKRVEEAVRLIFDSFAEALVRNERVEIRDFGSFESRHGCDAE